MAKKSLASLAKSYEVVDFYYYICESYINGNKKQALELFYEMRPNDRLRFMNELNYCTFDNDGPWQMDLLNYINCSLYSKGRI